jgi:hypothetical protein
MNNISSAGVLLQNDYENEIVENEDENSRYISPNKQSDLKLVDRSLDDYPLDFASPSPLTKNLKYAKDERFASTTIYPGSNSLYKTYKDLQKDTSSSLFPNVDEPEFN